MTLSFTCAMTTCLFLSSRLVWGLQNTPTVSLQNGKTLHNECPGYHTKQPDGEIPVMLELWGMQSTPLLPSLPDAIWVE